MRRGRFAGPCMDQGRHGFGVLERFQVSAGTVSVVAVLVSVVCARVASVSVDTLLADTMATVVGEVASVGVGVRVVTVASVGVKEGIVVGVPKVVAVAVGARSLTPRAMLGLFIVGGCGVCIIGVCKYSFCCSFSSSL